MTRGKPHPWLALLRVSNYPTVASNALTGCALMASTAGAYPWRSFAIAAPALVMIYAAGMVANDVLDVAVDRVERPNRPIPSGRVSRVAAAAFAVIAAVVAVALLALAGWHAAAVGAGLVACAALYDLVHGASALTVLLMASCRSLAYVTAATTVAWPVDWRRVGIAAGILGVYVVAISLVARAEAGRPSRVKVVVSMVCAISLIDAGILLYLGWTVQALIAVVCFIASAFAQRRIIGS